MAKIDVKFNDSGDATATTQQPAATEPSDKKKEAQQKAINTAVVALGKRVLSTAASQVGNVTGNYILQSQINNAITITGYAGQIAVGGWWGVLSVATDVGIKAFSYETDRAKANTQANYLAQSRGGLLNGNSR